MGVGSTDHRLAHDTQAIGTQEIRRGWRAITTCPLNPKAQECTLSEGRSCLRVGTRGASREGRPEAQTPAEGQHHN